MQINAKKSIEILQIIVAYMYILKLNIFLIYV